MTILNNGATASALPACLNKRKAAPSQGSLSVQDSDFYKAKQNLTRRQRRALRVLLDASVSATVKYLVSETNANNVPELIASLRRRGLKITCKMIARTTADGTASRYGVYQLAECDKPKALKLLSSATVSQGVKLC